ncbi:hypothetical protein G3N55_07550 [Dissulfurirhabdus thermomarina]|uniref:Outer membrane beta-barrel protein n=1 Tax=Dissulfurirhabdus thermomarina TaxID=1765737 RepID=A0A6N9TRF5_DISTH|nr:hypothetical protein [Dissulfurirhabdus thermomarina]NDY42693.1 hypothetical protein [Dissulfurirhabdus thermomarina]NMX24300.1 hypothetical protein [Dissulfurirhabdus thermomarina]
MRAPLALACALALGAAGGGPAAAAADRHEWRSEAAVAHIRYAEPGVMKERGMFYGLSGGYTYRRALFLRTEARALYGRVDYRNSGSIDDIDDYLIEARQLVGIDLEPGGGAHLTTFAGIGYRYLQDDAGGRLSSTGALGYERESHYLYSPVGLELTLPLDDTWSLRAEAEYDFFWRGRQESHLSDADPGYGDIDNRQDHGYGVRGALTLAARLRRVRLALTPYAAYWRVRRSDLELLTYYGTVVGFGYEPENESTEIGVRLGIRF